MILRAALMGPMAEGTGRPLNAGAIQAYVHEVADELPDGPPHVLVLVGGALLAWAGLRGSTADVDTIERLDEQLRSAVARVAARHDLSTTWLNDRAAGFAPATLREHDFQLLWDHPRLLVCGAAWRDVFLMKMLAARDRDWDDLVALWPLSGFNDPQEAVAEYYQAYPHEEIDPYLDRFVRDVQQAASS